MKKMGVTMLLISIAYSKAVFAHYTDYDDYIIHYFTLKSGETKNKHKVLFPVYGQTILSIHFPVMTEWQDAM